MHAPPDYRDLSQATSLLPPAPTIGTTSIWASQVLTHMSFAPQPWNYESDDYYDSFLKVIKEDTSPVYTTDIPFDFPRCEADVV